MFQCTCGRMFKERSKRPEEETTQRPSHSTNVYTVECNPQTEQSPAVRNNINEEIGHTHINTLRYSSFKGLFFIYKVFTNGCSITFIPLTKMNRLVVVVRAALV